MKVLISVTMWRYLYFSRGQTGDLPGYNDKAPGPSLNREEVC